ncbi:MAG: hypothetical protein WA988_16065 [Candidatus Nanopelagicales bacterium]
MSIVSESAPASTDASGAELAAMPPAPSEEPAQAQRSRAYRIYKAMRFWVVLAAIVGAILLTGLGASVVKTGSMRPVYQPGDLVLTINKDIVEPTVGSVVVATPWVAGEELPPIAHRVTEIAPDGSIKTKGDYNPEPDAWTDRPEDVDKTVIAHVPMAWALDAVKSPIVVVGGITLFALMLFWPSSKPEDELDDGESDDDARDPDAAPDDEVVIDLTQPSAAANR